MNQPPQSPTKASLPHSTIHTPIPSLLDPISTVKNSNTLSSQQRALNSYIPAKDQEIHSSTNTVNLEKQIDPKAHLNRQVNERTAANFVPLDGINKFDPKVSLYTIERVPLTVILRERESGITKFFKAFFVFFEPFFIQQPMYEGSYWGGYNFTCRVCRTSEKQKYFLIIDVLYVTMNLVITVEKNGYQVIRYDALRFLSHCH